MRKTFLITGPIIVLAAFYFGGVNTPSSDQSTVLKAKSKEQPQVHNHTKPPPVPPSQKVNTQIKTNQQPQPSPQKVDVVKDQHVAESEDDTLPKVKRPDEMVYATTPEGIDDAMRAFMPNIRRCYQAVLVQRPQIEGRITFTFQISENDDPDNMDIAKISDLEIFDTELDSEEMENCIMDNLDELWFDPPEGDPVHVRYPIIFSF